MKPEVVHTTVPDTEDYPPHWRGKTTEDLLHTNLVSRVRWHRHPMYWVIRAMEVPIFIIALILTPILWLLALIVAPFIATDEREDSA